MVVGLFVGLHVGRIAPKICGWIFCDIFGSTVGTGIDASIVGAMPLLSG